jgi:hypothetical protein
MLKRLLALALVATLGGFATGGCTDNSGNGNYNPDAKANGGIADGGAEAATEAGDDGTATTPDAADDTATADGGTGDANNDSLPLDAPSADAPLGG